jgi:hypothetical protein
MLALLALWLPVTFHCQLESIPGLEFVRCAADTSNQSDCSDDGCCAVEKQLYKSEQHRQTLPIFSPLTSAPLLNGASTLPDEVSLGLLTAAPPELLKTWQFAFRTASPPRAPSFAS